LTEDMVQFATNLGINKESVIALFFKFADTRACRHSHA